MFNANLFGNDEDIFDDSKSLNDTQSSDIKDSPNVINKQDFNIAMQSVLDVLNRLIRNDENSIEEAKNIIDHLNKEHKNELNNFITKFRVRLALTILDGAGSWIKEYQEFEIPRSVVYALDVLSENKFTLLNKFFNIELENAKRIVITRFLTDVFLVRLEKNDSTLQKLFNTGMDGRYINSYYGALRDINLFTTYQNNAVYETLSEELDIPCNQSILDNKEVLLDTLSAKTYAENKFSTLLSGTIKETIASKVLHYTNKYMKEYNEKNS